MSWRLSSDDWQREANRSLAQRDSKKIDESEDDEVSGYDLWQQRLRDDPRPEDKETRDEERKRLGKASPVDTSPEAQKMVSDVLAFIEESNWGTPQQAGDAKSHRLVGRSALHLPSRRKHDKHEHDKNLLPRTKSFVHGQNIFVLG